MLLTILICRISFLLVSVPPWKFQMWYLDAAEINNHSFDKDQNFTLQTAGTKPLCACALEFKTVTKCWGKKVKLNTTSSCEIVLCFAATQFGHRDTFLPCRDVTEPRRLAPPTLQETCAWKNWIFKFHLILRFWFCSGTQLPWTSFVIQVLSFGTGCRIFPWSP